MDELNFSGFGRGRGLWLSPPLQTVGGHRKGKVMTSTPYHAVMNQTDCDGAYATADIQTGDQPAFSVGQDAEQVSVRVLGDLVKQIGASIGENIVSCLKSIPTGDVSVAHSSIADLSKVNLTLSHHSYDPHPFRGDTTDKPSISEWEEAVKVYLKKRGVKLSDQAEEVLSKLQSRARDIVKVGLRSKPTLDLKSGPQPIFDILKQHFSESVTSFMPLADFYDTKPFPTESAVDYWIRLNKAVDTAAERLKRQGKTLDNPSGEVAVMFVTHCPDPQLLLAFSSRPLEEWTATDVQVRLDEHHQKKRLQQRQCAMRPTNSLPPARAEEALVSHVQTAVSPPAPALQPAVAGKPLTSEGRSLEHSACFSESLLHALGSLGLAIKPELGAHVLFVAVTIMTLCPTAEMNASASAAMLLDTEQSLVQPPLHLTHLLPKLVSLLSRKTSWPARGGD
ncbi:hypothetical protein N1851_014480 [Merluccius polli]|uniref:Uncharacterized protein n=1 Tax=Merluccius polli TaxID=89951 RepID=A0AA47MT86_MERPO|nr:hypothetical protein N1851_014480 [Merluccius polli]